jgi:transcriptional regulator with XRE-family HTH domain
VKRRKIIGQNVYRLRVRAGMTQTELADFTGLSRANILKIEHGKANITAEVIEKLARKFKCGWVDILGDL